MANMFKISFMQTNSPFIFYKMSFDKKEDAYANIKKNYFANSKWSLYIAIHNICFVTLKLTNNSRLIRLVESEKFQLT